MAFRRLGCYHSLVGALAMPLLPQAPNYNSQHTSVSMQTCVYRLCKLQKTLAQSQITRYKHIKGPSLPYMVPAAQPRLIKRVASFLPASGPTWRPPPPLESRLPHSHLYSSPRRFRVESHLLLGFSHRIPNWTNVTSGLSRRSKVASNTSLGPCSQGPSSHVLPYAAPGFLTGRGHRDWWSSPNFASILLAARDDTLTLCSGGRTQDQGMEKLTNGGAMVFLLGF
jgi:hypothetical protein